jgi:hypothetical protein
LERIALRDPTHQIPVTQDVVRRIFRMSPSVPVAADFTLENVHLSDSAIMEYFRAVLQ